MSKYSLHNNFWTASFLFNTFCVTSPIFFLLQFATIGWDSISFHECRWHMSKCYWKSSNLFKMSTPICCTLSMWQLLSTFHLLCHVAWWQSRDCLVMTVDCDRVKESMSLDGGVILFCTQEDWMIYLWYNKAYHHILFECFCVENKIKSSTWKFVDYIVCKICFAMYMLCMSYNLFQ